jgi:hypothetical protein
MHSPVRLLVAGAVATIAIAIPGIASGAIYSYTVTPKALLSARGTLVTVSGTITCDEGDQIANYFTLTEVVGRTVRSADQSVYPNWVTCTGVLQPWSITLRTFGTLSFLPGLAEEHSIPFDTFDFTVGPDNNQPIVLTP